MDLKYIKMRSISCWRQFTIVNRKGVPNLGVLITVVFYICLLYYKLGGEGLGLGLG